MSKPKEKSKLYDAIGPFTTIPNSVVKMIGKVGVDGLTIWVYLRYRTNGESGVAFPSYDTMQKEIGITRARISKALTTLEENGLLYRERRFSSSTVYELLMPPIESPLVRQVDYSSSTGRLPLVQQVDTNKTDITKTEVEQEEQPRTKRAGRTYSEHTKNLVESYYALLSEDERKLESYPKLLSIASKGSEDITPAALEAEFRAMRADAFYLDKTPTLLTILKRLAAKHATAQAAPSGARAGVRVVGQAVRNG